MPEPVKPFATAVVIHADGKRVLMHQREDFRLWSLPGGSLEDGETTEQAAVRETLEETGYHIEIEKFIGKYYRPQVNDVRFVYQAHVVGGEAIGRGPETLQVGWFSPDELPKALGPSVREIVTDTFAMGADPISKEIWYPVWKIWLGKTLIRLRNLRNKLRGRD